jgi:hypothetical protein
VPSEHVPILLGKARACGDRSVLRLPSGRPNARGEAPSLPFPCGDDGKRGFPVPAGRRQGGTHDDSGPEAFLGPPRSVVVVQTTRVPSGHLSQCPAPGGLRVR